MSTAGSVVGVNGNMVTVRFEGDVSMNEVGYILTGDSRLKSEVIRINGKECELQVFEITKGIGIGDQVEFSQELLAVELGPGLLTQVYDGLQNPLPKLAEQCGFFLQRGIYLNPLDRKRKWDFTPHIKKGEKVQAGDKIPLDNGTLWAFRLRGNNMGRGSWQLQHRRAHRQIEKSKR